MATGTNYKNGLSYRHKYSGNVDTTNNYERRAKTKLVHKQAVIHHAGCDAAGEFTTGVTLKAPFIVYGVTVNVRNGDSTATYSIGGDAASGNGDDPDGLIATTSFDTATIVKTAKGGALAVGTNETYITTISDTSSTDMQKGALLCTKVNGSDVTTDVGTLVEHPYIGTVDMPITITTTDVSASVADIIIEYAEVVQEDK